MSVAISAAGNTGFHFAIAISGAYQYPHARRMHQLSIYRFFQRMSDMRLALQAVGIRLC